VEEGFGSVEKQLVPRRDHTHSSSSESLCSERIEFSDEIELMCKSLSSEYTYKFKFNGVLLNAHINGQSYYVDYTFTR
jgi:hypothetical protein